MLTIPTTIRDSINQNNGKVVLLSIKKQWLDKILAGEKTIEVRKTRPWEFEYDVTDVVAAEYNLPTDVAKLVVQQVRDRDIGRSELASYLDHYAIFAETVLDAVF